MNRPRLWFQVGLTAAALVVFTVQLCRLHTAGLLTSADRGDGDKAAHSATRDASPPIHEFALFADETRAFCRATNRNRIDIRDVQSGETIASLDFHGKLPIAFSATSKAGALLVGYLGGSLVLWTAEAESSRYRARILGREPTLACCAISRDGRFTVTGHEDGTVILRDTRAGARLHRWQAHAGCVSCVRFSRDGSIILSTRRRVCLWDVQTGTRRAELPARDSDLASAQLVADGRFVLTADQNWGPVVLWNTETASQLWSAGLEKRSTTAMALSPDERIVAIGDTGGEVWLCEAKSGRRITMIPDAASTVSDVRFSADGTRLYVGRHDGSIRSWDVKQISRH